MQLPVQTRSAPFGLSVTARGGWYVWQYARLGMLVPRCQSSSQPMFPDGERKDRASPARCERAGAVADADSMTANAASATLHRVVVMRAI
jgi:hypothetical protein